VAVGDFNVDGQPDLAVADNASHSVPVLLGNPGGTFQAAVGFSEGGGGTNGTSIATGSFNAGDDGHLDLVVTNDTPPMVGGPNVTVLLGNGSGIGPSFGGTISFPAGTRAASVAVGDFNRDGHQDLAIANAESSNNVQILLGVPTGLFPVPGTTYTAGEFPASVAVGDFDRDGNLDLAVANQGSSNVSVFLGNGDGTFQGAVNFAAGTAPFSVAVGDFDRDGKPDLAVANAVSHDVSILLGDGSGAFQPAIAYPAGITPTSVAVGEFDRDGKPDLAVANQGSSTVSILLGNGDGTFQPAVAFGAGTEPRSVAFADLNRDGKLDVVVANRASSNVSILLNTCKLGTTTTLGSSVNPSAFAQPVTFTAGVTSGFGASGIPTGTVNFMDGVTSLGTSPLVAGTATLTTATLSIQSHPITAVYSGDVTFAGSTSPVLIQSVSPADLSITKTDGQTTVVAGSPIIYTIVVSNAGPNAATGATVTDAVPAAITGVTWTCAGTGGGACTAGGAGSINDSVNLPVGATVTYTLTGTVGASAPGNVSNTASVTPPATLSDPDPSNNSATDVDTISMPCAAAIVVVPDGRATQGTPIGPGGTAFWFRASLRIGNSYSLAFESTTGSTSPGVLTGFTGDDGCGGSSTLVFNDTSTIDPAGTGGIARLSFTAAGTLTDFRARLVNVSGSSVPFTFSWSDTTLFSPAWSTNGSFNTFYSFQNTTGASLDGELTLLDTAGATLSTFSVSVPAGQTASANTAVLPVPRGRSGTARFTHNGPPGAIVAEAAIANFTISPAYVQPVKFLPVRQ
jgi:uncharacterized repeat protein (TIGR01451 family)